MNYVNAWDAFTLYVAEFVQAVFVIIGATWLLATAINKGKSDAQEERMRLRDDRLETAKDDLKTAENKKLTLDAEILILRKKIDELAPYAELIMSADKIKSANNDLAGALNTAGTSISMVGYGAAPDEVTPGNFGRVFFGSESVETKRQKLIDALTAHEDKQKK